jgi:hypothetical protein
VYIWYSSVGRASTAQCHVLPISVNTFFIGITVFILLAATVPPLADIFGYATLHDLPPPFIGLLVFHLWMVAILSRHLKHKSCRQWKFILWASSFAVALAGDVVLNFLCLRKGILAQLYRPLVVVRLVTQSSLLRLTLNSYPVS